MYRHLRKFVVANLVLALLADVPVTYARGGLAGGGGRAGGGGGGAGRIGGGGAGGARPAPNVTHSPSFSAPQASRPQMSRPTTPSISNVSRPTGGGASSLPSGVNRPNFAGAGGAAQRPGSLEVSRPSGNRPGNGIANGVNPIQGNKLPGGGERPQISNRPSTPNTERPNLGNGNRPTTLPGNAERPQIGTRPNLPNGERPGIGNVNRPTTLPGNVERPQVGTRPNLPNGERPTTLPGNLDRPQIGNRPTFPNGERPGVGIANRPTTLPGEINRPGIGNRPNFERPTTLPGLGLDSRPGLGNGNGILNRPGLGDRPAVGNRPDWSNRPISGNLNDLRVTNINNIQNNFVGRNDWHNYHNNWQGWQNNHPGWHEDWHDWHHDWHHNSWCHGYWNCRWDHMWNNYPVAAAFGLTAWGVNRMSYWFGYAPYTNPYWVAPATAVPTYVDYSQPIIVNQPVYQEALVDAPAGSSTVLPPGVAPEAMSSFDAAQQAFAQGDYQQALLQTEQALKGSPNDAAIHEFRALTLFALGDYQSAAATLNSVLSVGPGWNWTTLIGLYGDNSIYTQQLRTLETFVKDNPDRADARFVLAYHYMTEGFPDAAAKQFRRVATQIPNDQVSRQLADLLAPQPVETATAQPAPTPEPGDIVIIPVESLRGDWKANGPGGAQFGLTLAEDNSFTWKYSQGDKQQTVAGTYGVDGDSLALQPDAGGVMLAKISQPGDGRFHFAMIGGPENDPGLDFRR